MLPVRIRALDRAKTFIGVKEIPTGSNRGPHIDYWLSTTGVPSGNPWCMAFVHAMYLYFGKVLGGHASVGFFEEWARQNGDIVTRPFKGDLVCYDWEGNGWPDHVGFVDKVLALRWRNGKFVGWVRTVEGNTSDQVAVKYRWINYAKFVRIPE